MSQKKLTPPDLVSEQKQREKASNSEVGIKKKMLTIDEDENDPVEVPEIVTP